MKRSFLILFLLSSTISFAQTERGKVISAPKVFQKKTEENKSESPSSESYDFQKEVDFQFEEEPKLRFKTSFEVKEAVKTAPSNLPGNEALSEGIIKIEPVKSLNETIHDDTSSIDEGQLMIVEIEESSKFPGSEEMIKTARYYAVWNSNYVDPYGIDPLTFRDIVPIKLYDLSKGRYWSPPLKACPITSHFGYRHGRWHKGTDIDLETGDPVYAAFDGIIRISGVQGAFGRCVVIRHYNGLETVYGHMSKLNFEENTLVKAGDEIGKGGNTGRSSGSHLHFETRYEGNAFDSENIFTYTRDGAQIKMQDFMMSPRLYDYLRGKSSRVYTDQSSSEDINLGEPTIEDTSGESDLEDEMEDEEPQAIEQKIWHRVLPGETLTKIARQYNTTIVEICALNKISSYKKLYVGIRLRVK